MWARLLAPKEPGGSACGAKRCGRDAYARYGHVHDQYGVVVWIDSTDTEAPVGEANPTGCRAQARPQVRRVRPARGRRVASGQAGH